MPAHRLGRKDVSGALVSRSSEGQCERFAGSPARGVGGLSTAGAPRRGMRETRFSRQGARPLSLGSTSGRLRASVASVVSGQGLVRTGGLNFLYRVLLAGVAEIPGVRETS